VLREGGKVLIYGQTVYSRNREHVECKYKVLPVTAGAGGTVST
jgi:hypothetical protein